MHVFSENDIICVKTAYNDYIYGRVEEVDGDNLYAELLGDPDEFFYVPMEEAEYVEPIYMDDETAKRFARYEITYKDVIWDSFPPERVRTKERYMLTIDDVLSALRKGNGMPLDTFCEEWFTPVFETMSLSFSYGDITLIEDGDCGYRFLPSADYCVWNAMDSVNDLIIDEDNDFSAIIRELEEEKEDMLLPVPARKYCEEIKAFYIRRFIKDDMLEQSNDNELGLFIQYVEELLKVENKDALYAKAYGCYGGNRAFSCDCVASRDCLLKLMEKTENAFVANTLGYIYYYGRCTDGVPDYEAAFKYFSIGAAGGVYESRYKLSDMFRHGYAVPKNENIAASLIWELYEETIKRIFSGAKDSKFADVALRLGNLFRDGIGCEELPNEAYYYYLQAQFAIEARMKAMNYYGDSKVAANIKKAIDEVLPLTSFKDAKKTVHYSTVSTILRERFEPHRLIRVIIKRHKDGEYSLKFRVLPRSGEKTLPQFFVTEPRARFCGYLDEISARTVGAMGIVVNGKALRDDSCELFFDSAKGDDFYLYGRKAVEIRCREYKVKFGTESKEK